MNSPTEILRRLLTVLALVPVSAHAQEKTAPKAPAAKAAPADVFGSKEAKAVYEAAVELFRRAQEIHDAKQSGDGKSAFLAAIAAFGEFEKQFPKEQKAAQAAFSAGTCHLLSGDAAKALAAYQRVNVVYPTFVDRDAAYIRIGVCHSLLGDITKAREAYQQAIREFGATNKTAANRAQKFLAESSLVGRPAPAITADLWLNGIGSAEGFRTFHGDVFVVTFFATWCGNCRKEWPRFRNLMKDLTPQGVQFLGVADPNDLQDGGPIDKYVQAQKLEFLDVAYDSTKKSENAWRVSGFPAVAVVDRRGVVRWRGHPAFLTATFLAQIAAEK